VLVGIIADNHFILNTNDGNVYVQSMYSHSYFKRYIDVYDNILVIARGKEQDKISNQLLVSGSGLEYSSIYDFQGIKQYILNYRRIYRQMKMAFGRCDCVIIRMPCALSNMAVEIASRKKMPFALEVGADPELTYRGITNPVFNYLICNIMKRSCRSACLKANGVSYVTKRELQKLYPCKALIDERSGYFTGSYSSVDIKREFIGEVKKFNAGKRIHLIHVSTEIRENSEKGHYECLELIDLLVRKGIDVDINFVGEGKGIEILCEKAKEKNISDRVKFVGRISRQTDLRSKLIECDVFIFPSYTEGLPRALIEAMACGLVCIASNVGGIPELLAAEDIFNYSDTEGMCNRIINLLCNPNTMSDISRRNINIAMNFTDEIQANERRKFYNALKKLVIKE